MAATFYLCVSLGLNRMGKADTTGLHHATPLGGQAEAFGPLVPLGSTSRDARTCGLSTSSSATAL